METILAMPATPYASAAWLRGRLVGALVCGFFGAVWMFEALYFGNIATAASLVLISACALAFIAWPVARIRSFPRVTRSPADRERWASLAPTYWSIVAIEWLLSAVAVNWLVHMHRYPLIPQALGVIIGVHFLPLARLFKMPLYYATGIVMVLGVLASLAIPASPLRNLVACGVDGLSLWATAAVIFCQDWFSSSEKEKLHVR